MQSKQEHIFFEGINGLRFFAAIAVVITHIELIKGAFGIKNYWKNTFVFNLGGLGVYFFFVLSGFLITYLLLVEKQKTNTISVKKFYWRRVLRIWPLYYLIVLVGFFILPQFELFHISYLQPSFNNNFKVNLLMYLLILPNLAFSIFSAVPNIGQTWSIGVEEQFYIAWPWIVKKSKNILQTLIIIIFSLIALKVIVLLLGKFYQQQKWYPALKLFIAMSKFECMAIGGIGAYYLFQKHAFLSYFKNKLVPIISSVLIVLLLYITPSFLQDGLHIVMSILFLAILLYVVTSSKLWLQNKLLDFLGKISYGLYMYHFMLIPLMLFLVMKFVSTDNTIAFNIILYSATIITSIAIASLSYYLFELKFIRLKDKFAIVKSGDI